MHESRMHTSSRFITLTYNDDAVPRDDENKMTLQPAKHSDFQLFMKRLRKKYGPAIRFFAAGEYGQVCKTCHLSLIQCICKEFKADLGRPHFHAILFNLSFGDEKLWKTSPSGQPIFISGKLNSLWTNPVTKMPLGITSVGDVTFESAAYVARYCTKKITGELSEGHYSKRVPEYCVMSRRPGIAADFFNRYKDEIYSNDSIVIRNNLICRPPKYYDSKYKLEAPLDLEVIKEKRLNESRKRADQTTPERLAIREDLQKIRAAKLHRKDDL